MIYTSGSTGRPKAVVMPGAGLVNLLTWHARRFPGGPGTRTAQFTAIGFDFSVQEILSPLVMGKTLVAPDEPTRHSAELLAAWLDEQRVNELFAPNLVVEALAEAAAEQGRTLPHLTDVLQGGEALVPGPGCATSRTPSPAGGCTTSTDPPRPTPSPPTPCPPIRPSGPPPPPSDGPWTTSASSCWTVRCVRCRRVSRVSCIWRARGWRAGT